MRKIPYLVETVHELPLPLVVSRENLECQSKGLAMNKLLELFHWMWIEMGLSSSPLVQDKVLPYLHQAKDTARLLSKPYLTIYRWRGQSESGPLTASYAGLGYAAPFIKSILFAEESTVTEVEKIPIWHPNKLANLSDSDLTIIEASKHLTRKLSGNNAVILPFQVSLVLDVRGSWEDVKRGFHRHMRKNELRFVRKYGYEYSVSHNDQDFDLFYHSMYLPTLKTRYLDLASPMSVQEAYQYFRHGLLFLIKREGKCVSGALCFLNRDVVAIGSLGVIDADEQLMKEGAQGVAWYSIIHWANQERYKYVDFGGCWPYIEGVFAYKRKWGSVASVSPRHENKRIWIKIQRDTPAVHQFLKENPCVIIDEKGELRILIVSDDPGNFTSEAETRWHQQYAMPGISGLLIRSVEELLGN